MNAAAFPEPEGKKRCNGVEGNMCFQAPETHSTLYSEKKRFCHAEIKCPKLILFPTTYIFGCILGVNSEEHDDHRQLQYAESTLYTYVNLFKRDGTLCRKQQGERKILSPYLRLD